VQLPPALLQWTGNTPLNRSIRLYATNLGYELDEVSYGRTQPRCARGWLRWVLFPLNADSLFYAPVTRSDPIASVWFLAALPHAASAEEDCGI